MKALIIGATGATGKDLLDILLEDSRYSEVVVFVRRPTGIMHPKLYQVLTDFDQPNKVANDIRGDILFSCLGTTLKTAGSKDKQWHIDYQVPLKFAEMAKSNGVQRMVLLSAYGADSNSRLFYSRIKGALEVAIARLEFGQYILFKPGSLVRKNSDRMNENVVNAILSFLNTLGIMKRFRPLPTAVLAEKMANAAYQLPEGKHIIELEKIFGF